MRRITDEERKEGERHMLMTTHFCRLFLENKLLKKYLILRNILAYRLASVYGEEISGFHLIVLVPLSSFSLCIFASVRFLFLVCLYFLCLCVCASGKFFFSFLCVCVRLSMSCEFFCWR